MAEDFKNSLYCYMDVVRDLFKKQESKGFLDGFCRNKRIFAKNI